MTSIEILAHQYKLVNSTFESLKLQLEEKCSGIVKVLKYNSSTFELTLMDKPFIIYVTYYSDKIEFSSIRAYPKTEYNNGKSHTDLPHLDIVINGARFATVKMIQDKSFFYPPLELVPQYYITMLIAHADEYLD